jgi:ribosome-binding ATPase YchF (GTP1/OBG family)
MQVGIVGAPNQGKSTFFNAATLAGAQMADYPFTTIKPNQGIGFLRIRCACRDFNVTCKPKHGYCSHGERFVPVTLLDVAGLVPGAHEGKGLGNQFLDDLRQASALIHVIDASGSTNSQGEKVAKGSFDPAETVRFLEEEIDLWFFGILHGNWHKFSKKVKQENKKLVSEIAGQFTGLGVAEVQVEAAIHACSLSDDPTLWGDEDLRKFATKLREISKPMMIVANKIDIPGAYENYERLKKEFPQYKIVPASAESELALRNAAKHGWIEYAPGDTGFKIADGARLDERQGKGLEFLKHFLEKYKATGVQEALNAAVFELLKYIVVYPVGAKLCDKDGNVLPDTYLMPPKTTALSFAYALHTDFGDNFVAAIDMRTKNKVGKEHELKNGDVVELVCGK